MDTSPPHGARSALLDAARSELIEHGRSAISLRAVARRAGVSHAAPKYHFGDRAGLLTAIAAEGFLLLTSALLVARQQAGTGVAGTEVVGSLGRAYLDFSSAHPALFDLMFRPTELHPDDPELLHAQRAAIGVLNGAVSGGGTSPVSLMSWALAHGLAVLARDGALQAATEAPTHAETMAMARDLTEGFAALVEQRPAL